MNEIDFWYRSVGSDRPDGRPPFHSKLLCLRAFLRAVNKIMTCRHITFVNDGPVPEDRLVLMRQHGDILPLRRLGNSMSYRKTLSLALDSDAEYVYPKYREKMTEALARATGKRRG